MTSVKLPKAMWLIIGFSVTLNASILDEIEKLSPHFFSELFDRELYNIEQINRYDENEESKLALDETLGQNLQESLERQIERLQQRKIKRVKKHFFPKIRVYKEELSKLDPQKIIPGLLKSSINGVTMGAAVHCIEKNISAAAIGGGAFVSSALQVGVDAYFNPTAQDELKKAEILCNRLIYEIKNESINYLEVTYLSKRSRLSDEQREAIEKTLLAERNDNGVDRHPDLKGFVNGVIDLPENPLIVPPNFVKAKDENYGEQKVDDAFVSARDAFLALLFPSLTTAAGVPAPSIERKLDTDYYPRALREKFKEIAGKICDYSYNSLSGEQNPVELRGIIFQGKPGTGKSQAAKLLAESCGLPYYHMTIQGQLDLDAIWGSAQGHFSDGQRGAIAQAFLTKNKDGKTTKNAIIIFDDIDRSQADDVLAFLMKLLDTTNMSSFLSRYFGFEIGMEDILVILTINTDWYNDPIYAGLKSRADFVLFPNAQALQLKGMVKNALLDRDFRLSTSFRGVPLQWDTIRSDIADFIIDHHDIDDNRQRISRAKTLLRYARTEWNRIAQNQGW